MTRVGHARAAPQTATAEPISRPAQRAASPDPRTLTPDSILALQRSAGNRAVCRRLQRTVTGDVLGGSVGIQFAEQLTPDEMRQQVALVVDALDTPKLDPTTRQMLEQNLEELEDYASGAELELPAATGYHLRQVIRALASDIRMMATEAKGLKPEGPLADYGDTDLNWSIEWLQRVGDTVGEAAGKVVSGEKGGPTSAADFAAAARLVTGAIPVAKAIAAHMAYLKVVRQVEKAYPISWSGMMFAKLAAVRDVFTPIMTTIWSGDSMRFDKAVAQLLYEVPTWKGDFSNFVENLEEKMRKRNRFLQWVGIFELALMAWDVWTLPVTGRPGGGPSKPPTIGGGTSGGAALAGGGVLVAVESAEALRRLVRLGLLTNPGLVKAVTGGAGGGPLATPKPMHAEPPKGGKTTDPSKGKATAPDPNARPAAGLPTPAEDAIVQEYTRGLANLREKRRIRDDINANPRKTGDDRTRAQNAYDGAIRNLKEIGERGDKLAGETATHLEPLKKAGKYLQDYGLVGKGVEAKIGTKVSCEAVRVAPTNLRGKDFAEIQAAMGRKPDLVDAAHKPPGGGQASAHQRLEWWFEDGSKIVVDKPGPPVPGITRPASAELPHVEIHGPKGERLDAQGIQVPEKSIAPHMTITDHGNLMERTYFGAARKKTK